MLFDDSSLPIPRARVKNIKQNKSFKKKRSQEIINEINVALGKQKFTEAHLLMIKLQEIEPNPVVNIRIAHLMYIMRNYREAELIYRDLLKTLPEEYKPEIYFGLGQVYYEMHKFPESQLAFSSVLMRSPDYKQADYIYLRLAKISLAAKSPESSLNYLKTIIKRNKSNASVISEATTLIAHIYHKQNNLNLALALAKEAVKIYSSFESITGLMFLILDSKPKEAEKLCMKVLSRCLSKREWNVCMLLRAVISIKLRKFEIAKNILENDVKGNDIEDLRDQVLGVALYKLGDKARALEAFRKFRRPGCCSDEAVNNLKNIARVYWELGMKFEAYLVANEVSCLKNGESVEVERLVVKVPEVQLMRFFE